MLSNMLKYIMILNTQNTKQLPDNPVELKKIIFSLNNSFTELNTTFGKLNTSYTEIIEENKNHKIKINHLEEKNRLLLQKLFGRKSEKYVMPGDQEQMPLFNEIESAQEEASVEEKVVTVPEHMRKKGGRKPIPDDLPCTDVIFDIPEEEKICGCGKKLKLIGQEVTKKLDIIPQKIKVIKEIRLKYAQDCECVETGEPTVKIAPLPPALIEKSIVTPGLASYIITSKFCDALPLYRQEKIFLRHGIEISRAKMCGWLIKISGTLAPLLKYMKEALLSGKLLNIDETRIQVLGEPKKENTTQSYMWCYKGGQSDKPVIIFKYQSTRSGEVCKEYIQNYSGYVQTDDYAGYNFIDADEKMIHILCWAHVRRKFDEVIKAAEKGSGKIKTGNAGKALSYIKKIYNIEKDCKEKELTAEQIKNERQERSVPILKEFKAWLDEINVTVVPKSLLGQAVNYNLSNWEKLIKYTENGHVTIDNNGVENAIRPFVIGRKNWLFSGAPQGADASALFYSLVETAKVNNFEPYHYIRYVLEKTLTIKDESEFRNLLPQKINREAFAEYIKKVKT